MDVGLILVFVLAFLLSYYLITRQKNLPPGPPCLPFLGNVQLIQKVRKTRPHLMLYELGKQYGPVFSFRLGKRQFVVLNGYDAIHEALVKRSDVFSDRPRGPFLDKELENGAGIIMNSYSHNWKVLRRFTLQALRDFGIGKSSLEEKIATEINAAAQRFIEHGDNPVDINACMQMVIGNVVYGIVFGVRYDYGDPEFDKVRLLTSAVIAGDGPLNIALLLPAPVMKIINMLTRRFSNVQGRIASLQKVTEFVGKEITQHEATFDENIIRDFIDLHIKTTRDQEAADKTEFTKGNLQRVINDLFIAGSETTSTSLDWAFLYMAEYPDVQKKCQNEIEKILGDKFIVYSDREKLPYLNATLMEIQRRSVIVPLSVAHYVREDTEFRGFKIPSKTVLIPNLYSASMDPKYWFEPEKFKPERFLGENGKLTKAEAFIPFSTGPRKCLGEPLAKMELFLVFANMLQRFDFHHENPGVKHSMKSRNYQATNSPEPYRLRVKSRK